MAKQVTNEALTVCFNCEAVPKKDWGNYFEFEDPELTEKPHCPECGSNKYTLPKFYLEEMSISDLAALFNEYAEETGLIPMVDLKILDFKLPHAIKVAGYKAV